MQLVDRDPKSQLIPLDANDVQSLILDYESDVFLFKSTIKIARLFQLVNDSDKPVTSLIAGVKPIDSVENQEEVEKLVVSAIKKAKKGTVLLPQDVVHEFSMLCYSHLSNMGCTTG